MQPQPQQPHGPPEAGSAGGRLSGLNWRKSGAVVVGVVLLCGVVLFALEGLDIRTSVSGDAQQTEAWRHANLARPRSPASASASASIPRSGGLNTKAAAGASTGSTAAPDVGADAGADAYTHMNMSEALRKAIVPIKGGKLEAENADKPPHQHPVKYANTPFCSDGKDPSLRSVVIAGEALRTDNCCPIPKPGEKETFAELSRAVFVENCTWWCLDTPKAVRASPTRRFVYRASAKSGSSATLVALTSLLRVMHMEIDYYIPSRSPITYGLSLALNHDTKSARIGNQFTKHAGVPFGGDGEVLLSMWDPRDQVVSGYHHIIQGHSPNKSAPVDFPPGFCDPSSDQWHSSAFVKCETALAVSARYNVQALVRRDELPGLFPINFPSMADHKLELLCRLADYMGFPWRKDEDSFKRVLRGFEIIVEHLSPKKLSSTQPLNEGIHFRSGASRRGYMKELSKESVEFLDTFLCEHYPLALAIWGRSPGLDISCDPDESGPKWWDFQDQPVGKRIF